MKLDKPIDVFTNAKPLSKFPLVGPGNPAARIDRDVERLTAKPVRVLNNPHSTSDFWAKKNPAEAGLKESCGTGLHCDRPDFRSAPYGDSAA